MPGQFWHNSPISAPFQCNLPPGPQRWVKHAQHQHALYLWALAKGNGFNGLLAYHRQNSNSSAKAYYLAIKDWDALKLGNFPPHPVWVDGEIVWGCTTPDEYGLLLRPMFRIDSSMEAAIIATTIARSTKEVQPCAAP